MNFITSLLLFARCTGFVLKAPGFSHPATPKTVRLIVAAALTVTCSGAISRNIACESAEFCFAFAREMAIGAAMGMALAVLYDGAYSGGRALDDYLGVRASLPSASVPSGSGFGRLWSNALLAAFFLGGGVERLVLMFVRSFHVLPLGSVPTAATMLQYAMLVPAMLLDAALVIVGPAIALAFFSQLALAALGRIVPRFSTFALSFPIIFAAALFVTVAVAPNLLVLGETPWIAWPVAHE